MQKTKLNKDKALKAAKLGVPLIVGLLAGMGLDLGVVPVEECPPAPECPPVEECPATEAAEAAEIP